MTVACQGVVIIPANVDSITVVPGMPLYLVYATRDLPAEICRTPKRSEPQKKL
jgi:hypothetical protein